jgi:hypothetical protein
VISANTLFHFTNSLDNLINILVNEFHPRFCLEDFKLVFARRNPPVPDLELAIPMVCFCDLPMSQLQRHLAAYGNYGIGLKKEWGRLKGITPVLYLHHDSRLVSKFGQLIAQLRDGNLQSQFHKSLSNNIFDFACFVKPYEGTFSRHGHQEENYRFYDEREWRYVPDLPDEFYRRGMSKPDFLISERNQAANERLGLISTISFEPNDIKYLVVHREEEIVPFITKLKDIKSRYDDESQELVASRVISAEQIKADF